MVFQYLESTLHTIVVAMSVNLGQAFRLLGTTFVKMVRTKLANSSIALNSLIS